MEENWVTPCSIMATDTGMIHAKMPIKSVPPPRLRTPLMDDAAKMQTKAKRFSSPICIPTM